jgi:hypothetical protein
MARYSSKKQVSEQVREQAAQIARGTQTPGQTKEQTKLIAQGIAKGIDLYKKQNKAKARDADRKARRTSADDEISADEVEDETTPARTAGVLPWILLILTWLGIGAYALGPQINQFL